MNWEEYKQIYLNFQLMGTQTRLISLFCNEILKDFPKNLPNDISDPVFVRLKGIFDFITKCFERTDSESNASAVTKEKVDSDLTSIEDDKEHMKDGIGEITAAIFDVFNQMPSMGTDFSDIDFKRIQLFQELIMHHSNFEGILSDSIRAVCYRCPAVMKSKKTLKWNEALSCSNWNELVDRLVEKFVRAMGEGTLEKRVSLLKKKFKLDLQIPDDDMLALKEIGLIRNLIVHNGGKVSQEYIDLMNCNGLSICDYVPLDNDYLMYVFVTLRGVASEIYIEISKKFFDKKEDDITPGIWHNRDH